MTTQHCIFVTLIMLFIILINLTGQSCHIIDSALLKKTISTFSFPSSSPSTPKSPGKLSSSLSPLSSLSPSADSSEMSRDSTIFISDLSSLSSTPTSTQLNHLSGDPDKFSDKIESIQVNHHGLKKKRYQPARYLVKPLWLNPRYTWKILQMNSSRNEAKEADIRKLRDKKRAKINKLADKMKEASLVSKKLYLLLNEISMSLPD